MSISMWFVKDYTDDGCSIYQCLNCYNVWESRTSPKYAKWKYCPVCGIEWTQEKKSERPEWKEKRWVNDEEPLNVCEFIIEKRQVLDSDEKTEWKQESECRFYIRSKADALYYIEDLRQKEQKFREEYPDWGTRSEYRISKKVS